MTGARGSTCRLSKWSLGPSLFAICLFLSFMFVGHKNRTRVRDALFSEGGRNSARSASREREILCWGMGGSPETVQLLYILNIYLYGYIAQPEIMFCIRADEERPSDTPAKCILYIFSNESVFLNAWAIEPAPCVYTNANKNQIKT